MFVGYLHGQASCRYRKPERFFRQFLWKHLTRRHLFFQLKVSLYVLFVLELEFDCGTLVSLQLAHCMDPTGPRVTDRLDAFLC